MSIVIASVVVAGIYATSVQAAFGATNLNSSKSNVYRQTTNQNQVVNGDGPATQTSTNTCDCPSDDDITVNDNDNEDSQG
jgi:hypothetical protein